MLLKDIAYQKIKEKIFEDHYSPGAFLSERKLIEDLEMSKTPIKNALVRLETEGFVTISSKQGIIVNDLSVEKINDIYNLRIALETFNCGELYPRLTEEQLNELKKNLKETEQAVEKLDVKVFARLDHAYHLLLSEMAGNKEITKILLNYHDHLLRITLRHLNKDPARMKMFYAEHLEIVQMFQEKKPESIELMRTHLQKSKVMLFQ